MMITALVLLPFQSTLPVRGGTSQSSITLVDIAISIHPPRAGRDTAVAMREGHTNDFNPPSPCGEGRAKMDGGEEA